MKTALIIGGLGVALFLTPAMRVFRIQSNSRMSDREYFAAARKRAIGYRLAKAAANERDVRAADGK